ncbi:hypothetical protein C1645_829007 [Glomus cerebriforme]|uniref:Uncharacterized protein n=1 Tax=Glomus cerebriforme TaxID=658196 RepID=A0A397SKB6_9GLOM|nr:hypothetical protein C1645_829007 [Glomus cerebriforme]
MAESLIMLILIHQDYYPKYPLFLWEHGTEALEYIFGISRQIIANFNFYEFYKIQKRVMYRDKISHDRLIDTSRDRTSVGYVFEIDGTSLSHEIIECLRTWPSEDDIKEVIHIGYNEAIELANYLKINNRTIPSIQQLVACVEFSCDDIEIIGDTKIVNDESDQNQNLNEQDELQTETEDIGTAAFEIIQLLLDESNDNKVDENEMTNFLTTNFPNLHYILNQKPIP